METTFSKRGNKILLLKVKYKKQQCLVCFLVFLFVAFYTIFLLKSKKIVAQKNMLY